jgi:hypothetical protein
MRAFVDQTDMGEVATLGAGIEAARQRATDRGRVVVEVKLDGRALTDEELQQGLAGEGGVSGARLDCTTVAPAELVATSFAQASGALDEARALQADAAGALRAGDINTALANLGEVVGVWEAVKQTLDDGPGLLGRPLGELLPGASAQEEGVRLAAALTALKTTLADQDWSTLADVLEVELDQQAERWVELLAQASRASMRAGSPGEGA